MNRNLGDTWGGSQGTRETAKFFDTRKFKKFAEKFLTPQATP